MSPGQVGIQIAAAIKEASLVYDAFVDDSKDRHAEKVVVAGIFIGDKQKWGWLRTHWNSRLHREGMRYFKTSEYYGLRGEFRKFR